jgi:hypothetical protein
LQIPQVALLTSSDDRRLTARQLGTGFLYTAATETADVDLLLGELQASGYTHLAVQCPWQDSSFTLDDLSQSCSQVGLKLVQFEAEEASYGYRLHFSTGSSERPPLVAADLIQQLPQAVRSTLAWSFSGGDNAREVGRYLVQNEWLNRRSLVLPWVSPRPVESRIWVARPAVHSVPSAASGLRPDLTVVVPLTSMDRVAGLVERGQEWSRASGLRIHLVLVFNSELPLSASAPVPPSSASVSVELVTAQKRRPQSFTAAAARNEGWARYQGYGPLLFCDEDLELKAEPVRQLWAAARAGAVAVSARRDMSPSGYDITDPYWSDFNDLPTTRLNAKLGWKYLCSHSLCLPETAARAPVRFGWSYQDYGLEDTELGFRLFEAGYVGMVIPGGSIQRVSKVSSGDERRRSLAKTAEVFLRTWGTSDVARMTHFAFDERPFRERVAKAAARLQRSLRSRDSLEHWPDWMR